MKRFAIGLACGVGGYVFAAVVSYFLVLQLSSNRHDRDLEAAMTSAFVFGPIGAIAAFVIGIVRGAGARAPSAGS